MNQKPTFEKVPVEMRLWGIVNRLDDVGATRAILGDHPLVASSQRMAASQLFQWWRIDL